MSIELFKNKKISGQKISLITCYDSAFARLIDCSPIDAILVGDSLAMVMHGHKSTLMASVELMATHTEAVSRGAPSKFIIADLPFLAHRGSLDKSIDAVQKLMRAGAHAIKIEGLAGNEQLIAHLVESGVPVMGHLGLTPQFVNQLGGYKVQGRTQDSRSQIIKAAKALDDLGVFATVLECVPSTLAKELTQVSQAPTIGIGAGPDTDGQILVLHDMLGLNTEFKPKFLREFLNGRELIGSALSQYHESVLNKSYPNVNESYE